MKAKFALVVVAAAIVGATSPYGAENEGKGSPARPAQMQQGGMGAMDEKQMAQMQERMKEMHGQMDRIHKAKDAEERQKLMQEHMQSMNETMKMMRGMGGGMMTGMMGHGGKAAMDPNPISATR